MRNEISAVSQMRFLPVERTEHDREKLEFSTECASSSKSSLEVFRDETWHMLKDVLYDHEGLRPLKYVLSDLDDMIHFGTEVEQYIARNVDLFTAWLQPWREQRGAV